MKLLVLEFWGLGDLTFATALLRAAQSRYEVTLVGKAHAKDLLAPSFPDLRFIAFDAPWSVYRHKYTLLSWNWRALWKLIWRLRGERFDAVVSVRNDPRDHLFMWLIGAARRYGFPTRGSGVLLNHSVVRSQPMQHKVEDWHDLMRALELPDSDDPGPHLKHPAYRAEIVDQIFAGVAKPVICVHPGARIPVRRWPEPYFSAIIENLRQQFDFHLLLIPDPDGHGAALTAQADTILDSLSVRELVDVLGRIDLLLCNDSGPAHLAASCDRPTVAIFGPTEPIWFRPWGDRHCVIIRDICSWRPCFDYCTFSQPYCLTKVLPEDVWAEIEQHIEGLIARCILTPGLRKVPEHRSSAEQPRTGRIPQDPGRVVKVGFPTPPMAVRHELSQAKSAISAHVGFYIADQNPHRDRTRGVTIYTDRLLAELTQHPTLKFTALVSRSSYRPTTANLDLRELPIATDHSFRRLLSDQLHPLADIPVAFWHYPKGYLPPEFWKRQPTLGNVHDVILQHYADHYPRYRSRLEYSYWLGMLKSSIPRFAAVFTLSHFSRDAILRFCDRHRLHAPPITVSSAGMDWEITSAVPPQKKDYVLHLASREPHKGTARLLGFWKELEGSSFDQPKLLIVGHLDAAGHAAFDRLKTAEHRPPLTREALLETLRSARALLLPSEVEGFGLPALESYALLTPVVFVNDTAVHEVLGPSTPGGFISSDFDSFREALSVTLNLSTGEIRDIRNRLAEQFTWKACAASTIEVYRRFADF